MISQNDRMNFALAMEKFMIMPSEWEEKAPQYVRDHLCRDGTPEGIAHHPEYGWFIMFCGQGPCFGWHECNLEEVIQKWKSTLR